LNIVHSVRAIKPEKTLVLLEILVFSFSLSIYTVTLAPGLLWGGGDFAVFQTRAYLLEIEADVLGHPLWVILTHPFTWLPIGDVAWRVNFASAVYASLALAVVFRIAWELTHSATASLLGTGALLVSHTFWTYGVMPKVYSLNALLLVACIYLIIRWGRDRRAGYLYTFACLFALSQLNHLVMATALAGFAVYIGLCFCNARDSLNLKQMSMAVFCFILGLVPYMYLTISTSAVHGTGGTITRFFWGIVYIFTQPQAFVLALGIGLLLLVYQFPATALVGVWGLRELWEKERSIGVLLLLIFLGDVTFLLASIDPRTSGSDYVWTLHWYLPAYVVYALLIAVGFNQAQTRWIQNNRTRQAATLLLTIALPILIYATAPVIVRTLASNVPGFRTLPGRDNFTYVLSPWKLNETGARPMGESILTALPPDSVLFADYSLWAVVRYLHEVEGLRPDVKIIELPTVASGQQLPTICAYSQTREVFLADNYTRYYDLPAIQEYYHIVPAGAVYHLIPKNLSSDCSAHAAGR